MIARDLPGHGQRGRCPRSYSERPLDLHWFATEPWPVARVRLRDCADAVIAIIGRLAGRLLGRPIVLVGHSMAGIVLNQVGEAMPHVVDRLVYLSAWMTANGRSFNDYVPSCWKASARGWTSPAAS